MSQCMRSCPRRVSALRPAARIATLWKSSEHDVFSTRADAEEDGEWISPQQCTAVTCGSTTCGSGQLCQYEPGGIDAGTDAGGGSPYRCDHNIEHCTVVDCSGNCSECLCGICGLTGIECKYVEVVGREVRCPGA